MPEVVEDEFTHRPELVKKRAQSILARRAIIAVIIIYAIVGMGFLIYNGIIANKTRGTLLNCTVPSQTCYERGQKQTADLVVQLIESGNQGDLATQHVVYLSAVCMAEPEIRDEANITKRYLLLRQCVDEQKKEAKK